MLIETPTIGEIIREEFMVPFGISDNRLATYLQVPLSVIQETLDGRQKITADTSARLGRYFRVSERYFLNLQKDIDVRKDEQHEHS